MYKIYSSLGHHDELIDCAQLISVAAQPRCLKLQRVVKTFVAAIPKQYVIHDMEMPVVFLRCGIKQVTDKKLITISCSEYI